METVFVTHDDWLSIRNTITLEALIEGYIRALHHINELPVGTYWMGTDVIYAPTDHKDGAGDIDT